ncbi:MAG: alpha/beta hydrolase, partial [Pseudomonas sp.]
RMNPEEVLRLNASHASLASRAAEVAALIDRAALSLA